MHDDSSIRAAMLAEEDLGRNFHPCPPWLGESRLSGALHSWDISRVSGNKKCPGKNRGT